MQLKTSEFRSLFSDGLNGLAGEEGATMGCNAVCLPAGLSNALLIYVAITTYNYNAPGCIQMCVKCDVDLC